MDVIEMVATFASAHAIFAYSRAVINLMQQVVLGEKTQGTENAGAIHVWQPRFGIGKRKSLGAMLHGSIYKYANGSRTYAVMLQCFFCVHYLCFRVYKLEIRYKITKIISYYIQNKAQISTK